MSSTRELLWIPGCEVLNITCLGFQTRTVHFSMFPCFIKKGDDVVVSQGPLADSGSWFMISVAFGHHFHCPFPTTKFQPIRIQFPQYTFDGYVELWNQPRMHCRIATLSRKTTMVQDATFLWKALTILKEAMSHLTDLGLDAFNYSLLFVVLFWPKLIKLHEVDERPDSLLQKSANSANFLASKQVFRLQEVFPHLYEVHHWRFRGWRRSWFSFVSSSSWSQVHQVRSAARLDDNIGWVKVSGHFHPLGPLFYKVI